MIAEDYFDSQLGIDIWNNKYRQNNESFDEWLHRVSGGNESVRMLIEQKKFMFAGRILANRGITDRSLSYSNCYVLTPPKDNLESIYECNSKLARTFSYGGGCGTSLSNLAPAGSKINNAAKVTSGVVSFANLYNETTKIIGQDGRRGALMLSLSSEHPDIIEFINAKANTDELTKCNISVEASNEFIFNAINNRIHTLKFRRHTGDETIVTVEANELLWNIAENAWDWSEPGMIYIDRMNDYNLLQFYDNYKINSCNPCGEEGLPDGGACLLGSINLANIGYDISIGEPDWIELEDIVQNAVYALNEVLDEGIEKHPLEEQCDTARKWRQIGLGVMGYADLLIKLGYIYGSSEAIEFTDRLMGMITNAAFKASAIYADKYNCLFPKFDYNKTAKSDFFKDALDESTKWLIGEYGLANATVMSIAPTGTISTMLGISGGIEPNFAFKYNRRTESLHGENKVYEVNSPILEWWFDNHAGERGNELVTASDIEPVDRLRTQSVFQKYTDAAISSTINLPETATIHDVYNIYINAWEMGLKGVTVHRSGNKREGVLTVAENTNEDDEIELVNPTLERGDWAKKPADTLYYPHKVYTGCGQIMMQIGYSKSENKIIDFWIKRSGKGGCERSLDNIAVAMSGMLRLGGNVENIQKAFSGINACNSFTAARILGKKLSKGGNCGNAMLNKLLEFQNEIDKSTNTNLDIDGIPLNEIHEHPPIQKGTICPECGAPMMHSGGCVTCVCGYSKCD